MLSPGGVESGMNFWILTIILYNLNIKWHVSEIPRFASSSSALAYPDITLGRI